MIVARTCSFMVNGPGLIDTPKILARGRGRRGPEFSFRAEKQNTNKKKGGKKKETERYTQLVLQSTLALINYRGGGNTKTGLRGTGRFGTDGRIHTNTLGRPAF